MSDAAEWEKALEKLEKEAPPANAPQPPSDDLKLPEEADLG